MLQLRTSLRRVRRLASYGAMALLATWSIAPLRACQPTPGATTQPSEVVQAEVVRLVNQERAAVGLPPLTVDARLHAAAKAHSIDQAAHNMLSHTGSNGSTLGARILAAGYVWSLAAENIAAGQRDARTVMAAWMASPPHRANILRSSVVHIGVANAAAANGTLYWTMVLARPG